MVVFFTVYEAFALPENIRHMPKMNPLCACMYSLW